jgi:hypothetical protein
VRAFAGLLVLLLLLPAAALAQVPQVPLPGAASVDVKAQGDALQVGLDAPAKVTLVVTNTEAASPAAQLDLPRTIGVSVEGAPDGWTAALDLASLQLKPQESRQVTLQVSVSADAVEATAHLIVTAKAYARGVNAVPLAGPNVDPEAIAHADVQATRADSPQRVLLETVGPYVWLLLLALVAALVIILTLVAANRRVAVRLSASEPQHTVVPGNRAVFPVLVHNITRRDDTIVLRVPNVAEGWATFLPTPQLDLEAGHQEEVPVVVIAPKDVAVGTRQPFTVTATSAQAPKRPASVVLEAEVVAPRRKGVPPKEPAPEA